MQAMDSSNAAAVDVKTAELPEAELHGENQQPEVFEEEAPLTALALPYAFAKRHGVLIGQIEDDVINLLHHGHPDPIVLAEVGRITRRKITLSPTTEDQFAALLAQTYEQGSNKAMQMVGDLDEHTDLLQVAQELPEPSECILPPWK